MQDDPKYMHNGARYIEYCTRLLREFGQIAPRYSVEQVEQGIWALVGYPHFLMDHFARLEEPTEVDLECVRVSYHPFADYVSVSEDHDSGALYMWFDRSWDHVSPKMAECVLETLKRILSIDDLACRRAALHGLNHLYPYPGTSATIDEFLNTKGDMLSVEERAFAIACRSGRAM